MTNMIYFLELFIYVDKNKISHFITCTPEHILFASNRNKK